MDADLVAAPKFSPSGGIYSKPLQVSIRTPTEGPWFAAQVASIRYTTDGTAPSPSNGAVIENGGTVTVAKNTTLKAMAFMSGFMDSKVSTARFKFDR